MNAAVQQAIETRISTLDEEIQRATEILTGYVSSFNGYKTLLDEQTNRLHVLELERVALAAALPEGEQPTEPEQED